MRKSYRLKKLSERIRLNTYSIYKYSTNYKNHGRMAVACFVPSWEICKDVDNKGFCLSL